MSGIANLLSPGGGLQTKLLNALLFTGSISRAIKEMTTHSPLGQCRDAKSLGLEKEAANCLLGTLRTATFWAARTSASSQGYKHFR